VTAVAPARAIAARPKQVTRAAKAPVAEKVAKPAARAPAGADEWEEF
jgi:hypothetical protein